MQHDVQAMHQTDSRIINFKKAFLLLIRTENPKKWSNNVEMIKPKLEKICKNIHLHFVFPIRKGNKKSLQLQ